MRPVKIYMSAFGPYPGIQTVDFTELEGRSFFLIHGPTGSGKTTILDAMCFALYGSTSGAQRNGKQMRSDYADLSTITEVVFDFTIGKEVYRIKRHPEQDRPKKKGAGTTVMNSNATLWKRSGTESDREEGTVMASGTVKVTEAVERLLGFKNHQFRQVVMLPQGEFRELLTANSAKRQEILETLFHTELYRRIELCLKESAKKLENELKALSERKQWILKESKAETREALQQQYDEHQLYLKELGAKKTAGEQALRKAQAELTAGQQTQDKIRERNDAQNVVSKLEARTKDMDLKRHKLNRARLALSLVDAEKSLKSRQVEAHKAAQNYATRIQQQKTAADAKEKADKQLAAEKKKETERETARREVTRLDDINEKVKALEVARRPVQKAREEVKSAENKHSKARETLTAIQFQIEKQTTARDKAQHLAGQLAALEYRYKEANNIFEKRKTLEQYRQQLNKALTAYQQAYATFGKAEGNYEKTKKELTLLQEAWNNGQAAILAGKLILGKPCPVCGSTEHPTPTRSDARLPSEEDIKNKQQELKDYEIAHENARKVLKETENKKLNITLRVEDLENALGEKAEVDLTTLQNDAKEAQRLWTEAKQAEKVFTTLYRQLEDLKEKEKAASNFVDTTNKYLQEAHLNLANAQATLQERESAIPAELRDLQALQWAQAKARKRRDQLLSAYEQAQQDAGNAAAALARANSEVQSATDTLQAAQKHAGDEERNLRQRLDEAGFKGFSDYTEAKRPPKEIQTLEENLQTYDQNLSAARDRLKRAREAAEGLMEPDLETLGAAVTDAQTAFNHILSQETEARLQIKREKEWLDSLSELQKSLHKMEGHYTLLGHLSDVANGKNAYGLTFQRFVLGALLDEVTAAATKRLSLMSRGRYHLHRTLDRARRNAAGGLELEVFDTYTGVSRGVATLSGGETFLASLSLALGLADVVQSYAGGIHLDTIFIDEGFGTLDTESLDFALRTLIDLRESGRLVGIISHVSELKERIDARLEISPAERGSTARFQLA
ncbi:MAG: SMC family ATPase [Firmicutes bacterium]|nr:SMC family ATPase [Bacillota bacterium]